MKKIIFCEGKNDSMFLTKLLDKITKNKEISVFDQNTRDKLKNLKNAETTKINKFIEKTSPYDILVKSEAGKDKAVLLFSRTMNFCFRNSIKPLLMLDLDESDPNSKIKKIITKISANKTPPIDITEQQKFEKNSVLLYNITVKIKENKRKENKTNIGDFYLVFFKPSLEKVSNILPPDKNFVIEDKISKLVDQKDIQSAFLTVFK